MRAGSFLILPFLAQGLAMLVDELHFHKKRGLPLWERLGHPLDTLTVLSCFVWLCLFPPSEKALGSFIGLAGFSCLFVTKDEFIHSRYCSAAESWLHALLFILHPLCFFSAGSLWWLGANALFLRSQTLLLFLFMVYQLLYWNFAWKPQDDLAKSPR